MKARTEIQIGLVIMGLIIWGYGERHDDQRLRWVGIGFFAVATALRFLKRRQPEPDEPPPS